MNKIIIEVSIGELLDKISILEIKRGKIKDPEKLKFINNEHAILKSQLEKNIKSDEKLNELYQSLKEINSSDTDNVVMEEISKSQNQLTKEIRSLYKKNEEIFSKIKSSDGLIKYP